MSLIWTAASCGKKGPPQPYSTLATQATQMRVPKVRVVYEGDYLTLHWQMPAKLQAALGPLAFELSFAQASIDCPRCQKPVAGQLLIDAMGKIEIKGFDESAIDWQGSHFDRASNSLYLGPGFYRNLLGRAGLEATLVFVSREGARSLPSAPFYFPPKVALPLPKVSARLTQRLIFGPYALPSIQGLAQALSPIEADIKKASLTIPFYLWPHRDWVWVDFPPAMGYFAETRFYGLSHCQAPQREWTIWLDYKPMLEVRFDAIDIDYGPVRQSLNYGLVLLSALETDQAQPDSDLNNDSSDNEPFQRPWAEQLITLSNSLGPIKLEQARLPVLARHQDRWGNRSRAVLLVPEP